MKREILLQTFIYLNQVFCEATELLHNWKSSYILIQGSQVSPDGACMVTTKNLSTI